MYLAMVNEHVKEISKAASNIDSYSEKFEEFLAVFDEKESALIWLNGFLRKEVATTEKLIAYTYELYEVGNPVPIEIEIVVETVERKAVVEKKG